MKIILYTLVSSFVFSESEKIVKRNVYVVASLWNSTPWLIYYSWPGYSWDHLFMVGLRKEANAQWMLDLANYHKSNDTLPFNLLVTWKLLTSRCNGLSPDVLGLGKMAVYKSKTVWYWLGFLGCHKYKFHKYLNVSVWTNCARTTQNRYPFQETSIDRITRCWNGLYLATKYLTWQYALLQARYMADKRFLLSKVVTKSRELLARQLSVFGSS